MSDDDSNDSASVAAQHDVYPRGKLKVAPTDGSTTFNTIRIPLIPVACWRLGDPGFAFDSSFVAPAFRDELTTLSGIVGANPECPAALFGHCDPAGSDALNKTLGDRRVIAIYALLTRPPDLWADLYDKPEVGDRWGLHAVQTMLSVIVGRSSDDQGNPEADPSSTPYYGGAIDGQNGPQTAGAVKAFQSDCGQAASGTADAATRKVLFGAYMDALCTPATAPPASTPDGPPASTPAAAPSSTPPAPFRMQATDFLGGAAAQPGDLPKMSLQGCSKFNPVVLLTSAEMQGYDGTTTRNADDAPNRRVVMYMFDKGTKVDSSVWPCPKVKETVDGCKAAFWSDGDQRRKNGDKLRLYKDTRDTMACRFYDRFARRSPCEGAPRFPSYEIGVFTGDGGWPLDAVVRFSSSDRGDVQERTLDSGSPGGAYRFFRFSRVRPGVAYSAELRYGGAVVSLLNNASMANIIDPEAPEQTVPQSDPLITRRY